MVEVFVQDLKDEEAGKEARNVAFEYVDEFDEELQTFLLGKRVTHYSRLAEEQINVFTKLPAQ
jgi:hypothetical protein